MIGYRCVDTESSPLKLFADRNYSPPEHDLNCWPDPTSRDDICNSHVHHMEEPS